MIAAGTRGRSPVPSRPEPPIPLPDPAASKAKGVGADDALSAEKAGANGEATACICGDAAMLLLPLFVLDRVGVVTA